MAMKRSFYTVNGQILGERMRVPTENDHPF